MTTIPNKIYVNIYCKIYTDTFPHLDGKVTGEELYNYLISDCKHAYDDDGNLIKGDHVIWYLGCNEKFGNMSYELEHSGVHIFNVEWSHGESSFENVDDFINNLHHCHNDFFTKEQIEDLLNLTIEGRKIDCMYDIPYYLQYKNLKKKWTKTDRSESFRDDFKKMIGKVKSVYESNGYRLTFPNQTNQTKKQLLETTLSIMTEVQNIISKISEMYNIIKQIPEDEE